MTDDATKLRLEYLDASELADNPANWRLHGDGQLSALEAIIKEVGWAGALLYNEATGRIIDGHARKKISTGKVPVLVGSWTEDQERKILATLDPLAAMAEADEQALGELLAGLEAEDEAVRAMLDGLAAEHGLDLTESGPEDSAPGAVDVGELSYRVIVSVADETQQAELIERLEKEGFDCLPLMS